MHRCYSQWLRDTTSWLDHCLLAIQQSFTTDERNKIEPGLPLAAVRRPLTVSDPRFSVPLGDLIYALETQFFVAVKRIVANADNKLQMTPTGGSTGRQQPLGSAKDAAAPEAGYPPNSRTPPNSTGITSAPQPNASLSSPPVRPKPPNIRLQATNRPPVRTAGPDAKPRVLLETSPVVSPSASNNLQRLTQFFESASDTASHSSSSPAKTSFDSPVKTGKYDLPPPRPQRPITTYTSVRDYPMSNAAQASTSDEPSTVKALQHKFETHPAQQTKPPPVRISSRAHFLCLLSVSTNIILHR